MAGAYEPYSDLPPVYTAMVMHAKMTEELPYHSKNDNNGGDSDTDDDDDDDDILVQPGRRNEIMLATKIVSFSVGGLAMITILVLVIVNALTLSRLETMVDNSLLVSGRECVHETYIKKRHCSLTATTDGQTLNIPCAQMEELVQAFAAATGNVTLMIQAVAAQTDGRSFSVDTQNLHEGPVICRGWDIESRDDALVGLKYCLPLRRPRDFVCGHMPI